MMKKRILASSMASVMALSSVSVVAFADEKKDFGEAVTKAELQEYIDSLQSFIETELDDYGTVQGDYFAVALAQAQAALEIARPEGHEYTAAYQMLKAVKNKIRTYNYEELKALYDDCTGAINTGNVLNEVLNDPVYDVDDFDALETAYYEAQDALEVKDDIRAITDAYLNLKKAKDDLTFADTITKGEFRQALKEYEALEVEMAKYESWRRGTCTVNPSTGSKAKLKDAGSMVTFGDLRTIVYDDIAAGITIDYWNGSQWKNVSVAADTYVIGKKLESATVGTTTLKDAITAEYEELDGLKGVTKTSLQEYIDAYDAAVDAVKVFKGWEVDSKNTGTQTSTNTLLKTNNSALVSLLNSTDVLGAIDAIAATSTSTIANYAIVDREKLTVKAKKPFAIVVIGETNKIPVGSTMSDLIYADKEAATTAIATAAAALGVDADKASVVAVSTSKNVLDFLSVDSSFTATVAATAKAGFDTAAAATVGSGATQDTTPSFTTDAASFVGSAVDLAYWNADDSTAANVSAAETANAKLDYAWALYELASNGKNAKVKDDNLDALKTALKLYEDYSALDWKADKDAAASSAKALLGGLIDGPQLQSYSGSSKEWTFVWRNLTYAIADVFPVAEKSTYTLDMLKKLADDSYATTEKTGDSAAFAVQKVGADPGDDTLHMAVVNARQNAYEFYKAAKALGRNYETTDTLTITAGSFNLEEVYEALNGANKDLNKAWTEFEISYGEIRDLIAKYATEIEDGKIKSDKLLAAIEDCAYELALLDDSALQGTDESNFAFDDDGNFQPANRLKTKKEKVATDVDLSGSEKRLKKAYDAMKDAYESATAPETVVGDLNGDGKVTKADVKEELMAIAMGKTDAKFDVDGDGAVTKADVKTLLVKIAMSV